MLRFPDVSAAARPRARSLLRDLADGWAEFSARAWLWLVTVQSTWSAPTRSPAAGPVAAVLGARAVLGFGAAWAAFGTLVVLAVPSVRSLTWQDTPAPSSSRKRLSRTNRGYSPSSMRGAAGEDVLIDPDLEPDQVQAAV
jgi:hypothetical protein